MIVMVKRSWDRDLEAVGYLAPTTKIVSAVLIVFAAVAAAVVGEDDWGDNCHCNGL